MLSLISPEKLTKNIAAKAKAMRLSINLSRKTLASRTGIPEATVRHFENSGQIPVLNLTKIALVLNSMDEFNGFVHSEVGIFKN